MRIWYALDWFGILRILNIAVQQTIVRKRRGSSKKNMDNADCPVYLWGINNTTYSLQLTPVKPGLYSSLPQGRPSEVQTFNYIKDPQSRSLLNNTDNQLLIIQSKEWLRRHASA
ncbi:hypothetical protein [Daejeonella sp.]|uniref:hypothetical protein n=1 Tax=Daejeonella sp. TaxID=2805397 RepID=UPI0030BC0AD3